MFNLSNYKEIDINKSKPEVGDLVYYKNLGRVELLITDKTDIIQEEIYPMVENFGCVLLRHQSFVSQIKNCPTIKQEKFDKI